MQTVVLTIGVVLLFITLLLVLWQIVTHTANRRDLASQSATLTLLHQQLEALKAAQDKTSTPLLQSVQSGQTTLTSNLQASQQTLTQLHTRLGELQGTSKHMLRVGDEVRFRGEYEWNQRGGLVHWTHHDPAGRRTGGWLRHEDRLYQ